MSKYDLDATARYIELLEGGPSKAEIPDIEVALEEGANPNATGMWTYEEGPQSFVLPLPAAAIAALPRRRPGGALANADKNVLRALLIGEVDTGEVIRSLSRARKTLDDSGVPPDPSPMEGPRYRLLMGIDAWTKVLHRPGPS